MATHVYVENLGDYDIGVIWMYSDQERINRLEHLLREQEKKNEILKNAVMKLAGSLAVELGATACKSILNEFNKF